MAICEHCGNDIAFRYIDGICTPIHCNGGNCTAYYERGGDISAKSLGKSLSYHLSMKDLAQKLGYSIVFPVYCRYCGDLIYLFASPEGGFAIFGKLGRPWPKHLCGSIQSMTREYSSPHTPISFNA